MPFKNIILAGFILIPPIVMGGCTSARVEPGSEEYAKTVRQDHQNLQKNDNIPKELTLSIDRALEVAVQENLDAYVAALEHLGSEKEITLERIRALPSLRYTLTRHGRSEESASSSFSVLTGSESLEPSISQERYKVTRDITMNWNIIDTASALMQGEAAKGRASASGERYRKVVQNIHRDVYASYWRAKAGDDTAEQTAGLIEEARAHVAKIDKAAQSKLISKTEAAQQKEPYLSNIASLEALQTEFELAEIELKSLLNLPQSTALILTSKPSESLKSTAALMKADMEALELSALHNRPEMREAFIDKNLSIQETRQEIIRTVPGGELFFAFNKDTNRFLSNHTWRSYTLSLVQNITNLISFPDRYLASRQKEDLSEARRFTLAAALMAQVHISRHGLVNARKQYESAKDEKVLSEHQVFSARKQQSSGRLSKGDALFAKLQAQQKTLEYYQSLTAYHEAYATFVNTLGFEHGERVTLASLEVGAKS